MEVRCAVAQARTQERAPTKAHGKAMELAGSEPASGRARWPHPTNPGSHTHLPTQKRGDDGDARLPADLGRAPAAASSRASRRVISGRGSQPAGGDQAEQLGVGVRGHAVAAEHLQLPADHPLHRHLRAPLRRRQQADLHVPAARAQAADRVRAGDRGAEGVERDVRAPAGQLGDRRRHVAAAVHRVLGAELAGQRQRRRARRRRRPPGRRPPPRSARRTARRPPQPCTATHSPARTRRHLHDRAEGGREPAAQRGGGGEVAARRGRRPG